MKENEPIYNHFWFVWGIVTVIYGVLGFTYGSNLALSIGLFVPFGLWNTLASASSPFGLVAVTLLLISLWKADTYAVKLNLTSPLKRLIFNLVLLFVLTLCVDLVLWQSWASMALLLQCPSATQFGGPNCGTFLF